MQPRKTCYVLLTIMLVFIPTVALSAGKHALLIGIQDYAYYGDSVLLPSLHGALRDVVIVKKMLQERFGFQEHEFIILVNAEATHTNIEQAFHTLIERTQPGDFVYIHYSGHGSQTKDWNGDEPDGLDETWVPYGARKDNSEQPDNYDVLDDEINSWLAEVYAKTDQVVFVSDSCHSATVFRNSQTGIARTVEADTRDHPLGKKAYTRLDKLPGIRIGAARDDESALEVPALDGQYYGVFT